VGAGSSLFVRVSLHQLHEHTLLGHAAPCAHAQRPMQPPCERTLYSNLECLNEKHGHPAANALKQGYREDGEQTVGGRLQQAQRAVLLGLINIRMPPTAADCSNPGRDCEPAAAVLMTQPLLITPTLTDHPIAPRADGLFCESDTDEQLLFNIPFHQKVKLQSITFKGPADGTGPKCADPGPPALLSGSGLGLRRSGALLGSGCCSAEERGGAGGAPLDGLT